MLEHIWESALVQRFPLTLTLSLQGRGDKSYPPSLDGRELEGG
jgi:hypothetical protein